MSDATRSLRILVVEDNPVAAEMMYSILRNEGFDVPARAATAKDALQALEDHGPFDAAVVDLELPDTAGHLLLEQLRAATPRTRLVACSAHANDSETVNAARAFADSVIPKEDLVRSGQVIRNLCRDTSSVQS